MMMRSREQIKAELAAKLAVDADNLLLTNAILLSLVVPLLEEVIGQLAHLKKREEA
jgi:hypothetical protein